MSFWMKNQGKFIFEPHQVRLVDHCVGELTRSQVTLLYAATGSGKSAMSRAIAWTLRKRGVIHGAIGGPPMDHIKESWVRDLDVGFPQQVGTSNTHHIRGVIPLSSSQWIAPRGQGARQTLVSQVKYGGFDCVLVCHGTLVKMGMVEFQGLDLSRCLLIIDEDHHLGLSTGLYKRFVKQWLAQGGKLLMVTATPWKTSGDFFLPDDVVPAVWTYAQNHEAGFAPAMKVIAVRLKGARAHTIEQLQGDELFKFEGDGMFVAKQFVAWWDANGRPKYIHNCPPGNSERFAQIVAKAFRDAGARVFVSVGANAASQKEMRQFLQSEASLQSSGSLSEFDVLVVVRRGEEGTDWSTASVSAAEGISFSMVLQAQRHGRTSRLKVAPAGSNRTTLPDYEVGQPYRQHADEGKLVLFIPDKESPAWELLWTKQFKEATFLLGSLMAGTESTDFLALARNHGEKTRKSRGGSPADKQAAADAWERFLAHIGISKVEYQKLLQVVRMAALEIGRPKPGEDYDEALKSYLMRGNGMTEAEADLAILVKRMTYAFRHLGIIKRCHADVTRGIFGPVTSRSLVLEQLQKVFHDCVDMLITTNADFWKETTGIVDELGSKFSGIDTEGIRQRLRKSLPTAVVTLEDVEGMVHNYVAAEGTTPTTSSGHAGKYSPTNGYLNVTFHQANRQLTRLPQPTNLKKVCARLYPPSMSLTPPKRPGGKAGLVFDVLANGEWHPVEEIREKGGFGPHEDVRMWVQQLRREQHGSITILHRKEKGESEYKMPVAAPCNYVPTAPQTKAVFDYLMANEGTITDISKVVGAGTAAVARRVKDLRENGLPVRVVRKEGSSSVYTLMGTAKPKNQIEFEAFHKANPKVIDRFITLARDSNRDTVTLDYIYSQLRYDENDPIPAKARNFPSFYNAVILGIAPDLNGKLTQLRTKDVQIDWNALGYTPPNGQPPQLKPTAPAPRLPTNTKAVCDFFDQWD